MKIGITGATGQLGQLVVEHLKSKANSSDLVALVRDTAKAASLDVEARPFDYTQPEVLVESLKGIDRLLLISSNEIGQRAPQHQNVIDAAVKAGVQHIVYTSILRADTSKINLAGEHVATEKMLADSGIAHTILRNGWYTENYTMNTAAAVEHGAVLGSAGSGKISSATRNDFAEAAAVVLTDTSKWGKTYELSGDQAYTLSELAAEISAQSGKEVVYQNLPEADYASALKEMGLPDVFAFGLASWDVDASNGELFDEGNELSELIGRPTTSLSQAVSDAL